MQLVIKDSVKELAETSIEFLHGPHIAISGGSTFAQLFEHWAPVVRERVLAGENIKFFPVDERRVPFEHADSNWRVCYEKLLVPADLEDQKAHHVTTRAEYEELLKGVFKGDPIVFDTVFLGMGEDGHTASLFPGSGALLDTESTVIDITDSPKPPAYRVTLGPKPLRESKTLVAVILGESKAEMVRRLADGDETLPITQVMKRHPHAVLFVDHAAASRL